MGKDWLLCIGAGQHQQAVLERARAMGYSTLVVDIDPSAPAITLADRFICHSAWDADGILNRLPADIKLDIRGVVTQAARGCTYSVPVLAKALGLPHLDPDVANLFLDKKRALGHFNVGRGVAFEDVSRVPTDYPLPCVVKFLTTSGGLGNYRITSRSRLEAIKQLSGSVVVEPFVDGRHLGWVGIASGAAIKSYGIVERFLNDDMTINRAVFPAQLDSETAFRVKAYGMNLFEKTGFDFGPFQLELILEDNGALHFVELEPSILGSYISEWMIPAVSEQDMIADAIQLAVGESISFDDQPSCGVAHNLYVYEKDLPLDDRFHQEGVVRYYGRADSAPVDPRQYIANVLIKSDSFDVPVPQVTAIESKAHLSSIPD